MLDISLALGALFIAGLVRAPRFGRLRSLTLPLTLTAIAAIAHFLATTFATDPIWERWTTVALVLTTGFLAAKAALLLLFEWVLGRRMGINVPQLVREVVALILYFTLTAILLRNLGVEITGLIATSAVITVVVGLALQQTLGNLLAGMVMAWEQRLTTGTWIEVDGEVGRIEETGWRSMVIRTRLHDWLLMPNSVVAARRVAVLGRGESPVAVPVRLGVAYGVPPDAAKTVFASVAADTPGILKKPAPRILTVEFADSAVVYECRLWTRTPWQRDDITDAFLTRAHAALARNAMEIPFPQRTLHRPVKRAAVDTPARRKRALVEGVLFRDLPESAFESLTASSRILRFAPEETVLREGDASTALYQVVSGTASIRLKGRQVSTVDEGEVFGEVAFLTGNPRAATVCSSARPLEVLEVDSDALHSLLASHPELAEELADRMAIRALEGESFRDESGAIVGPKGLVGQLRSHLRRFVRGPES